MTVNISTTVLVPQHIGTASSLSIQGTCGSLAKWGHENACKMGSDPILHGEYMLVYEKQAPQNEMLA